MSSDASGQPWDQFLPLAGAGPQNNSPGFQNIGIQQGGGSVGSRFQSEGMNQGVGQSAGGIGAALADILRQNRNATPTPPMGAPTPDDEGY